MGNAEKRGLFWQVCEKPNANIFAGRVSNAKIGMSSLINWAVGLYPCEFSSALVSCYYYVPQRLELIVTLKAYMNLM